MSELPRHYSAWLEASALLRDLRQSAAVVGIKDGQLSISAPKGALSASRRAALSDLKSQILALLQLEQRPPLLANNSETIGPLTPSQSRMWFLQKLHPNSDLLNLSGACQISGCLDLPRLQGAFQTLGQRQSALRTVFPERAGKAFQQILPQSALQLEIMPQNSSKNTQTEALTEIKRWCSQPFDLSQGPLMRMGWWPLGEQRGILVWSLHHLISDGWSTGVLLQELLAAYHGLELPKPVITGLDLAQQALHEAPWSEPALAFYRQALAGFPPGLDLPGETCPQESGPAEVELAIPETLWEQILAFGKNTALTPFQICLTAWTVLLSKYGLQERMIIGTPVSGRSDLRLENLIGCLINTLLLPLEVKSEWGFAQNCGQHAQQFQVHVLWQDLPFEKAVAALPKSEHPLPEVYFVFQNSPLDAPPLEFEVQWLDLPQQPPPFPLTLTVEPGRLRVRLSSSLENLGPALLQQILANYLAVFSRLLAQPELPLKEIPLLKPETQAGLLQMARPQAEMPVVAWIHQFVERQAAQDPERVALLWQGQDVTYNALNHQANHLAQVLRRQGLKPGMCVAFWHEVGPEALISLLAILKAGALYLPIDQDQPALRTVKILNFAQPDFLLASAGLVAALPHSPDEMGLTWLEPDRLLQEPLLNGDEGNLDLPIQPEDLAYMIFTSGSTGEPNGVEITHGQVARLFPAVAREVDLSPEDTWVLFHSLAFDYSIWEIWGAFYVGARLLLIPRALARDSAAFWQTLIDTPVTALNLTPSALRGLQGAMQKSSVLPPLRWLILSGEKLETDSLKPWFARFGEQVAVYNSYGITETTVFVTFERIRIEQTQLGRKQSPLGHPLQDLGLCLLDAQNQPVPAGVAGEINVTGAGLARGYFENAPLTQLRFSDHPLLGRVYRSGDFARQDFDGRIHYLSRRDAQLKIRGFRLEAAEIEGALTGLPAVADARVALRELLPGQSALIAYLVGEVGVDPPANSALRQTLQVLLPPAWIPDHFVWVPALPLNLNGKLDLKALPLPQAETPTLSLNQTEKRLHSILMTLNGGLPLDPDLNFMDQGLHSLLLVEAQYQIEAEFGLSLSLMDLFAAPTLRQLAEKLRLAQIPLGQEPSQAETNVAVTNTTWAPLGLAPDAPIAVIAMAGRFPGADSVDALWDMLCKGETGLKRFSRAELLAQGVSPLQVDHPQYVPVTGVLPNISAFDRGLFQLSVAESRLMDPQQRLFLETAWQTLEQAGYGDCSEPRRFGVFAGAGISRYLLMHLAQGQRSEDEINPLMALLANDKDYLATRVAYHLNLTGPALAVQTACSTSLVAVHLACESLRRGECEMALAGGVTLDPDPQGYLHQPGGIYSADGACRPFEAEATGIVGGSGVALVLLKPLAQAQADGDLILGQILSSAINNDGKQKVGFSAPGIAGQVDVLRTALAHSGLRPEQIRYLEAHGTGTALGDAVEIQALSQAWASSPAQTALGSLKANLGHLDAAAGVAGLIKALLVLRHKKIPPQPGFKLPNPGINWHQAPVYPAQTCEDLSQVSGLIYGAVSSFGIGGTNAHAILAGPPEKAVSTQTGLKPARVPAELFLLSARSPESLEGLQGDFRAWLQAQTNPAPALADLAYTLALGRQAFPWRLAVVAQNRTALLQKLDPAQLVSPQRGYITGEAADFPPPLLWLLPGLGSQVGGMGQGLAHIPAFAQSLQTSLALIEALPGRSELARQLTEALMGAEAGALAASELADPRLMQPLIFLLSYALGQTWLALGLQPALLLGHSFGEYAALCLGGYLDLPEMLDLVCLRGELFAGLSGFSWAVMASADQVEGLLPEGVCIAALNADHQLTLSGPLSDRETLAEALRLAGLRWVELPIPHAVHHPLLEPLLDPLSMACAQQPWRQGQFQVFSALLGRVLVPEDLSDPLYWRAQTREPVPFAQRIQFLFSQEAFQPLETGPGRTLSALLRGGDGPAPLWGLGSEPAESCETWLSCLGKLWQRGYRLQRQALFTGRADSAIAPPFHRWALPGTPFERQDYWFKANQSSEPGTLPKQQAWEDWFWGLEWRRHPLPGMAGAMFEAHCEPHSESLTSPLFWLKAGQNFEPADLAESGTVIFDCRAWARDRSAALLNWALQSMAFVLLQGVKQLCFLLPPVQAVTGSETDLAPDFALLQGLARVGPSETPGLHCLWLESDGSVEISSGLLVALLEQGLPELALRNGWLWEPQLLPQKKPARPAPLPVGNYLISGGSGEIGGQLAEALPAGSSLYFIGRQAPSDLNTRFASAARVHWIFGDVAQKQSWEQALSLIRDQVGTLTAVIHAAGSPDQHWLGESVFDPQQTAPEDLPDWPVFAKWQGAKHLLALLPEMGLAPQRIFFCSALSSFSGQPGQWAYTAANAALNALAGSAWQAGLPVQAIAWGAWKEGGMAQQALAHLPVRLREMQAALVAQGIDRESGKASLAWLYSLNHPNVAVSPLKPAELLQFSGYYLSQQTLTAKRQGPARVIPAESHPQGRLEQTIAQIWAAALGVEPLGREESWQDLGGDSLLALQVRERLSEHLQRPVSPALLFQGSTVASLAETLQNERVPSLLVPLRREGKGQALYCVHAISGTVFPFQTLAKHLTGPFYALQSQGLTGQPPHLSLEAMAAAYLDCVIHVQPEGPLLLSGWSFGALVAFEMARQALARGRNVSHLVLLDLPLPPPGRVIAEPQVRMRFDWEMQKLGLSEGAGKREDLQGLNQVEQGESRKQTRDLLYAVFEANLHAARSFKPTVLNLPATLVVAESGLALADPRPGKGWQDYLSSLTVLSVPGDHYSMLEGAGVLALARLCERLQTPFKGAS
ncbi:MAG: amino acid adenylation domain-containing protein [Candidatus Sericytochromatia bacterium]